MNKFMSNKPLLLAVYLDLIRFIVGILVLNSSPTELANHLILEIGTNRIFFGPYSKEHSGLTSTISVGTLGVSLLFVGSGGMETNLSPPNIQLKCSLQIPHMSL